MIVKSITIGGVSIGNTPDSLYRIGKRGIDGMENPPLRIPSFDLSQDHGAIVEDTLYGGRTILIDIQIVESNSDDYLEARRDLLEAVSANTGNAVDLIFTLLDDLQVKINGVCKNTTKGEDDFGRQTFGNIALEFFCQDPLFTATTESTKEIYLPSVSGGFTIPLAIPFAIGTVVSDGKENVSNTGNFRAKPYLSVYGIVNNPTLKNNTTGESIKLIVNNTNSTDILSVDTKNKNIVNNGVKTMSLLDTTLRDFFAINPGSNEIEFEHEGVYNANTYLLVTWYNSYIGF